MKKDDIVRAAIFCRLSEQEDIINKNHFSKQEVVCRDFAITTGYHIEYTVVSIGSSLEAESAINGLLEFCSQKVNGIKAVIVTSPDRFSRNIARLAQIHKSFRSLQIKVVYVNQ